jgi:uncharacterized membrane protein (DUF485 family)
MKNLVVPLTGRQLAWIITIALLAFYNAMCLVAATNNGIINPIVVIIIVPIDLIGLALSFGSDGYGLDTA